MPKIRQPFWFALKVAVGGPVLATSAATLAAPVQPPLAVFVDCGARGDRSAGGAGTERDPIRDLATLNRVALRPGTTIRLRRGSVCRGTFKPAEWESGRPGAPIVLAAYGARSDGRPLIAAGCLDPDRRAARPSEPRHLPAGQAMSRPPADLATVLRFPSRCSATGADGPVLPAAIHLRNVEYWEIRDVEVTNDGPGAAPRQGILIELQDFGDGTHYVIDNVAVHHVRGIFKNERRGDTFAPGKQSGGIQFRISRGATATGGRKTRFVDVTVQNSVIWAVDLVGLSIWSEWMCRPQAPPCRDYRPYNSSYASYTPWSDRAAKDWHPSQHIVFRNNYLHDIGGDAIIVRVADRALIEANLVTDAWTRAPGNSAAIWAINADNSVFQYNEVRRTHHRPKIEPGDGMAFDADMGTFGTVFRRNYSADNVGGFALLCGCGNNESGYRAVAAGTIIADNFSLNDGRRTVSIAGSEATRLIGNIVVTTRSEGTPVVENIAGNARNVAAFIGNRFVTAGINRPVHRTKNPAGPSVAVTWTNNVFEGGWGELPSGSGNAAVRGRNPVSVSAIAKAFADWSQRSGFAHHRYLVPRPGTD